METVTLRAEVAAKLIGAENFDELTGLLDGVAEENISTTFADAVAENFAAIRKKVAEDKLRQGEKRKGQAVEKMLAPFAAQLGIEGFRADSEGLAALVEKMGQEGKQTVDLSTLTTEQIQALPAYQKALDDAANANQRYEETLQEFNNFKQSQERTTAYNAALTQTISLFEKENAITGNASKADAARLFLSTIPADKLTVQDGNVIVLGDDGQPATDNFGKPISFASYVKDSYAFGFGVAPAGSSGSGAGAGANGSGGGSGITITSQEQGETIIKDYKQRGDHAMAAKAQRALSDFLRQKRD